MNIRRAEEKDIPRIIELLKQVLQIHADIRPDIFILRHQIAQYPAVNNNADLEFLNTPQCKVRNSSYEFAMLSKNKILRDF